MDPSALRRWLGVALVASAWLSLAAHAAPRAAVRSCETHPHAALDLQLIDGQLFVPVTINTRPVFMYLELAVPFTAVSEQVVQRLALPTTTIGKALEIIFGERRVQRFAIADVRIADIDYPAQHLLLDPQSTSSQRYVRPDVAGVLGIDLLWTMDMDLDVAQHTLQLLEPSACPNHPVDWASHAEAIPFQRDAFGNFFFPIALNGQKLEAVLSTADAVTTLASDAAKRVYGVNTDAAAVRTESGTSVTPLRTMRLTAGTLNLNDEVKLVTPPQLGCRLTRRNLAIGYTDCLYQYPLRLGTKVLQRLHLYIATKDGLMYFTSSTPEGSAPQDSPPQDSP